MTWVVRAATGPVETIIAHAFGAAVIKEAASKRPMVATECFQAPPRPILTFVPEKAPNYIKSWVGHALEFRITKDVMPRRVGADGAVAA